MRIGVLSDTHIHLAEEIPQEIIRAFSNIDLIVHAGDFVGSSVLEGLQRLGGVKAVHGNVDSMKLRSLLPDKELLVVGGRKIGLTHGWGGPEGIEHRVRELFDDVDIIIYGHSHRAKIEHIGGVLFFNPGPGWQSFGILTIGEDVKGEIIKI
ncbi:MAG: metallophosphoesterase family protein [Chloroflexi bacterium]|nr:metallophosphoesterase family protein [Chloroflexota bacterium]